MKYRRVMCRAVILIALHVFLLPPAATHAQGPLVLSIHPYLAATEIHKRFSLLAEYLSKELGRPMTIHIENTYESHVNAVGTGEVDIAFMGPASYIKLTQKYGKRPLLAAFETKGGRTFRGVIVVRKDSPIKTLSQLRGKKVAFGDVNSTMSYLVPRSMLLEAAIDLNQLGKIDFVGNHENIALGVLSGSFDAGALKEDVFKQYEQEGLRALAVSDPMPDHLFVARAGLPEDVVRKITKSLLSLKDTEDGRRILGSLQNTLIALVPARDEDYDPLRRVLDSLARAGVNP